DTAHSIELTRRAEGCGVAGALVVTPYYNRPSQAGLERHFRAVAEATSLPILVYDIPVRTGRKITQETFVRLRDVANIVGVNDAAPNPVPAKAMMRVLGHAVGECRSPMGPTPAGLEDRAREVLAELRG